jgi:hypothetical protein
MLFELFPHYHDEEDQIVATILQTAMDLQDFLSYPRERPIDAIIF